MYDLFEKFAANRFNNNLNKTEYSFNEIKDENVKKELKLIQRVQLYNDVFAEQQLIAMYRGQLSNIVNSNTKLKNLVGYDQAYQKAVSVLKNCIRNFNLKAKNKPITYFTTNISLELEKFRKEVSGSGTVNMAANLRDLDTLMVTAENILRSKLGREPTTKELNDFMKKDLKSSAKFSDSEINRVKKYKTTELTSTRFIGQGDDGAEKLTLEDINNVTDSAASVLSNESTERQVIKLIQDFTTDKNQRRFLMMYLGVGEFKFSPDKRNIVACGLKNGIIGRAAKRLFEKFCNFAKSKGVV